MKEYYRICDKCKQKIHYLSYSAWYTANKKQTLCRSCSSKLKIQRSADLSVLLDDSLTTYYWMGFLLADGSFHNNRLNLTLSVKDFNHLLKFANYINYNGSYGTSDTSKSVKCKDIDVISKLKIKFGINDNKTYNPPVSILKFSSEQNLALLAGFIDGDGYICKVKNQNNFRLHIKNHKTWLHILKEFSILISGSDKFCRINKHGYAELIISNTELLKQLKINIIKLNIPIMDRKWNNIDLNFTSRRILADRLKKTVLSLRKLGFTYKQISERCNTSIANISKIINNVN